MPYSVEPLSPDLSFGKIIRGLTSSDIEQELVREDLRRYWVEDGLVLFRDGEVNEDFQLNLSRVFGPLEAHPVKEIHTQGKPELITLTSAPDDVTILEIDGEIGGGFLGWHTDLVYVDRINHGGVLRALQTSSRGGITGFIDQINCYERLPEDLKERIEGLDIVYQLGPFTKFPYMTHSRLRIIQEAESARGALDRAKSEFPPVAHPLVFTQPETGRKVLNLSPFFALHIDGMDASESDALMRQLSDHVLNSPAYHHAWSLDEMILWDNWRMLHSVSQIPIDETRIMQRTTITGDYAKGRKLAA
ncbi:MAG: TauD/TfdA family dioxygenase [Novosphingobium sp.]|nr:TauD/TfdA family dioxygenase [Novosphingobium sp.]